MPTNLAETWQDNRSPMVGGRAWKSRVHLVNDGTAHLAPFSPVERSAAPGISQKWKFTVPTERPQTPGRFSCLAYCLANLVRGSTSGFVGLVVRPFKQFEATVLIESKEVLDPCCFVANGRHQEMPCICFKQQICR